MFLSVLHLLIPYVVLFLVHHFLLAPLMRNRKAVYAVLTTLLLVLFGLWCFYGHPRPEMHPGPPPEEGQAGWPMPPEPGRPSGQERGPLRPEWMELAIGILLLAGDLGLIAYIRMRQNERQMQELRAESLRQQLESLRYQINPHFLMNTLNNIQSLILTDPEKATEIVDEFSKMMRFLLYDGNDATIPISRELDFLRHYVSLMRLRYPDSVRIEAELPEDIAGAVVPPMVMASFVENAFKHGISYEKPSFVRIKVENTRARILFRCRNSRHALQQTEQHGLGMENVKKRLSLLYGADYALHIEDHQDEYDILLDIPTRPEKQV